LNNDSKVCEIQCKEGYWANTISYYNKSVDGNDQRCTYNNCKNWDYDDITSVPRMTAKTCKLCWDKDDVAHPDWTVKSTYNAQELIGSVTD